MSNTTVAEFANELKKPTDTLLVSGGMKNVC